MIIKKFLQFINEELGEVAGDVAPAPLDPEEVVQFKLSDKLMATMESIKDNKVAQLLFNLDYGYKRKFLVKDPVNYLDIDNENNISFLKSRYFTEQPDPWTSTRRIKTKATKILKEIFNDGFLASEIKQTDIESFSNKLAALKSTGVKVEEFRGEDVLRGYNYKKEFNLSFGHSCANFNQKDLRGGYREPWVDEYDVYVKNPENCGVCVVWDDGKIVARRSFQQGIQVCDCGDWKKGEHHTVWGNFYGIGGSRGKYDVLITDYLKKKYNAVEKSNGPNNSALCIHMETRWKNYPAFDSMYVCFEHNLLTDRYARLPEPFRSYSWNDTYPSMDHLHAPQKYIDMRLKEEEEKLKPVQPELEPTVQSPPAPAQPEGPARKFKEPENEWGGEEGREDYQPTYYRDKFGRFRKKTS